ncbi:Protein HEXIM1 [Eumeta japonica]|uniref:Protein HEXIM1 n=1 Tax=Eumeta variegata TaxID=151549 RepID=A0A4C1YYF7_EUMVA|nr:Protein HEXIM1 [Eumeta japonica]
MEVNNSEENKDGGPTRTLSTEAPPVDECAKDKTGSGSNKRKRRRGKTKRKMVKPFLKFPWQDRRRNDKSKRNNRFRKVVVNKTRAPYNNNQFLMEIHKPEPENNFHIGEMPSARTRDSSFSIDSDENYFYSLPEDEEDFLTKEFSSVYEDAQSERLSNMSKNELIQEYLILESKYENLVKTVKRSDRSKVKYIDEDDYNKTSATDKDTSVTDKDSDGSDKDTTIASGDASMVELPLFQEISKKVKDQEDQIRELKVANDKLRLENEHLRHQRCSSSSADSESDSSTTSFSCSSISQCASPVVPAPQEAIDDNAPVFNDMGMVNNYEQMNGEQPLINDYDLNGLSQSPNM